MTVHRHNLADLFAACWKDAALKHRFMADPKAVLAEYGMGVPDGMDVNVVENTDTTVHISLPAPPSGHENLSDAELTNAAGGVGIGGMGIGIGGFGADGGTPGSVD